MFASGCFSDAFVSGYFSNRSLQICMQRVAFRMFFKRMASGCSGYVSIRMCFQLPGTPDIKGGERWTDGGGREVEGGGEAGGEEV